MRFAYSVAIRNEENPPRKTGTSEYNQSVLLLAGDLFVQEVSQPDSHIPAGFAGQVAGKEHVSFPAKGAHVNGVFCAAVSRAWFRCLTFQSRTVLKQQILRLGSRQLKAALIS